MLFFPRIFVRARVDTACIGIIKSHKHQRLSPSRFDFFLSRRFSGLSLRFVFFEREYVCMCVSVTRARIGFMVIAMRSNEEDGDAGTAK